MATESLEVVGVDAYRRGWIAVVLENGRFANAAVHQHFRDVLDAYARATVVAVDIPIGLPDKGGRETDELAKKFVGPRRSSVFPTPPRAVLAANTYDDASRIAQATSGLGLSQQSYALLAKIRQVDALAEENERVIEVHPEVSFCAMAGKPLEHPKISWNGFITRRELLSDAGIELPDYLEAAGIARCDDVLDAAAAAWSANRYARKQAASLPNSSDSRGMAIWY